MVESKIIFEGKLEVPKGFESVMDENKIVGSIVDKVIQEIDKTIRNEKRKIKVELKITAFETDGKEIDLLSKT